MLPPAVVEHRPDPAIEATGIDVVVGAARPWTPGVSLSLSYGLGGQNGAVVLGPPPAGG
jgi:3-oxoacyl-(acyl-carrier-protein) synthase